MIVGVGQKINQLTILEDLGTRGKAFRRYVKVKCDCGTIKEVRTDSFPRAVSCGSCMRKLTYLKHKDKMDANMKKARDASTLPKGEAAFNSLYMSYSKGAENRGYSFNLTKLYFRALTQLDCHYCGTEPSQKWGINKGYNGEYTFNGVDRKDNSKGYSIDNAVSCCGTCNRIKHVLNYDEFLAHVTKIYKNRTVE